MADPEIPLATSTSRDCPINPTDRLIWYGPEFIESHVSYLALRQAQEADNRGFQAQLAILTSPGCTGMSPLQLTAGDAWDQYLAMLDAHGTELALAHRLAWCSAWYGIKAVAAVKRPIDDSTLMMADFDPAALDNYLSEVIIRYVANELVTTVYRSIAFKATELLVALGTVTRRTIRTECLDQTRRSDTDGQERVHEIVDLMLIKVFEELSVLAQQCRESRRASAGNR
jgi:hypothetical protein